MNPSLQYKIKNSIVAQQDQMDCGPACLLSIVRYFGGEHSLDYIKEASGTTPQGTTLLGLYQATVTLGLSAEAYQADIESLKVLGHPTILHIELPSKLNHYVVCYGYTAGKYHLMDPVEGYVTYDHQELSEKWRSRKLLVVETNTQFKISKKGRDSHHRFLLDIITKNAKTLTLALLLGIVVTSLHLTTSIFTQRLVDDILPSNNPKNLIFGLLFWGLLLCIAIGVNYLRDIILARQTYQINVTVAGGFIDKLLRQPMSFFHAKRTGDMVSRMNDTEQIEDTIKEVVSSTLISSLMLMVSLVVIYLYSVAVGVILSITLPAYFAISYLNKNQLMSTQKKTMQDHAYNEATYIDTIKMVEHIKVANAVSFFSKKMTNVFSSYQSSVFSFEQSVIKFSTQIRLFETILLISVVSHSAFSVVMKELMLGELMALMGISSLLMQATYNLSVVSIKFQGAKIAFDRMAEFTQRHEGSESIEEAKDGVINFEHLTLHNINFRFVGQCLLLNSLSLTVNKGEIIGLFGEVGSGKSTLLQIIQKFYHVESGGVNINGKPYTSYTNSQIRNAVGVVPQQIHLLNGNLIENISMNEDSVNNEKRVISFCKTIGIDEYFESFPESYYTLLGESGANISGGQKQLVGLARALYQKPQLLLLDEPTSATDYQTRHFIVELLQKLRPSIGILIVSHILQDLEITDRVYVLEGQTISDKGTVGELSKRQNLLSKSMSNS